jgi:hypothetical protein
VIENQALSTGSTQSVELRAQDTAGRFGRPLLALDSGHYPAGPGQVALTSQVASLYDVKAGGTWHADGRSWLVTGIVENPTDLNDEFAQVASGQVTAPTQVTILFNAPQGAGPLNLPWWASATGMALAVVTSVLAARRPARAVARVPVVATLSGRPAAPKGVHRSAVPGLALVIAGVVCLFFSGGWGANGGSDVLLLLGAW